MAWNDDLDEGTPAYHLAAVESQIIRAVAGPGSGKSFAMKRRVARLIESGISPDKILAITFTRTAAQDIKHEISTLQIEDVENVNARTLHSHALRILMNSEVLENIGRTARMIIDHEVDPALSDIEKADFGGIKGMKKLKSAYLAAWACLQQDEPGFTKTKTQEEFENDFIQWLINNKVVLVGEVVPVVIDYLRNNPSSNEIGKYEAILVDEYQDLNRSEQEFVRLIRGDAQIVILGDDDQSIYGFKYAHPEGIREIDTLYGNYEDIPFNECRRCPKIVTAMASALISKNKNRTLGDLIAKPTNHNGIVQIIQWEEYEAEIDGLARIIKAEIDGGLVQPGEILILSPRRRIGYKLRDKILTLGLPVKSYFREDIIAKDSVRRAYSLLHYLAEPEDSASLRYLLGYGSADYRKNQYQRLKNLATEQHTTVIDILTRILNGQIPETNLKTIVAEYRKIIGDLTNVKASITGNPEEGFQQIFIQNDEQEFDFYEFNQIYKLAIQETGFEELNPTDDFPNWFFKVFRVMVEKIVLPEPPEDIDHIRIMSMHASKGLSAKFVILSSMINNLMPFVPDKTPEEEVERVIEEQRRLFYVAITRCKTGADYPGRLIVSSFLYIQGIEALRMGILAPKDGYLKVQASRFFKDFGQSMPSPVRGNDVIEAISEDK